MKRLIFLTLVVVGCHAAPPSPPTPDASGSYRVLRSARVGGEGGTDYIYADVVGRRLYIPRGGSRALPATDSTPGRSATAGRITVFDLESLAPLGEIPGTGGNGVAVDPASGHGFSSSNPVSMGSF